MKLSKTVNVMMLAIPFFMACESKVNEKSASQSAPGGISIEERLSGRQKMLAVFSSIDQGLRKSRHILDLFRKLQDPSESRGDFKMDLFLKINSFLNSEIPQQIDGMLQGKIELPEDLQSEACHEVQFQITVSEFGSAGENEKKQFEVKIGDCSGSGTYNTFLTGSVGSSSLNWKIHPEALSALWRDKSRTDEYLGGNTETCKVEFVKNRYVERVNCQNLVVFLSKSESALVQNFSYDEAADDRLSLEATSYESDKPKSSIRIKISGNQAPEITVQPLGLPSASETQ